MQTKVVILDPEIGTGLAKYILLKNRMLRAVICENTQRFEKVFTSDENSIGIISDEEREKLESISLKSREDMLFTLCSNGAEIDNRLLKYQSAEELLKKIYRRLIEQKRFLPGAMETVYGKEIISFCSASGYETLSNIAFIFSMLKASEKKTLFLNLCVYDGVFADEGRDLGSFLYELDQNKTQAGFIVESIALGMGPLRYILPSRESVDIDEMSGDDLEKLTGRILTESDVETLVICLPTKPLLLQEAYRLSNRIISLRREGVVHEKAQARLRDELKNTENCEPEKLQEIVVTRGFAPFEIRSNQYEQLLTSEPAEMVREIMREKRID